jgi:G3E family GTPase
MKTRILIMAGFLGVGKTSLLLHLLAEFRRSRRKVFVIENEVGISGIDNEFLAAFGYAVEELVAGCICCDLKGKLHDTAARIIAEEAPDYLLIEPSGVAAPGQVIDALGDLVPAADRPVILAIDAPRALRLLAAKAPFVARSLVDADIIALNKIDLVDAQEQAQVVAEIKALVGDKPLFPVVAVDGRGIPDLLAAITHGHGGQPCARCGCQHRHGHHHEAEGGKHEGEGEGEGENEHEQQGEYAANFSVQSRKVQDIAAERVDSTKIKALLEGLRHLFTGSPLPWGHIKALVRDGRGHWLKGGLVGADQPVQIEESGILDGPCRLTLTAIVPRREAQSLTESIDAAMASAGYGP